MLKFEISFFDEILTENFILERNFDLGSCKLRLLVSNGGLGFLCSSFITDGVSRYFVKPYDPNKKGDLSIRFGVGC